VDQAAERTSLPTKDAEPVFVTGLVPAAGEVPVDVDSWADYEALLRLEQKDLDEVARR
jgi:hypothetical protein